MSTYCSPFRMHLLRLLDDAHSAIRCNMLRCSHHGFILEGTIIPTLRLMVHEKLNKLLRLLVILTSCLFLRLVCLHCHYCSKFCADNNINRNTSNQDFFTMMIVNRIRLIHYQWEKVKVRCKSIQAPPKTRTLWQTTTFEIWLKCGPERASELALS